MNKSDRDVNGRQKPWKKMRWKNGLEERNVPSDEGVLYHFQLIAVFNPPLPMFRPRLGELELEHHLW